MRDRFPVPVVSSVTDNCQFVLCERLGATVRATVNAVGKINTAEE